MHTSRAFISQTPATFFPYSKKKLNFNNNFNDNFMQVKVNKMASKPKTLKVFALDPN